MTIAALPSKTLVGKVFNVDPTPIQGGSTLNEYHVKATLDNTAGLVKPGMSGDVTINTETKHDGITIPSMSVQQLNGIYGVYLLGKPKAPLNMDKNLPNVQLLNQNLPNGVYFEPVTIGFIGNNETNVTGGLAPGDRILLGEGRFMVTPKGQQYISS